MKTLDLNVFETMDYSEGATVEGNTELPKRIVDMYYEGLPEAIGFVNGYAPSYTFAARDGKAFMSYDYYLSPERPEADAVADLQELARINDRRPYYLPGSRTRIERHQAGERNSRQARTRVCGRVSRCVSHDGGESTDIQRKVPCEVTGRQQYTQRSIHACTAVSFPVQCCSLFIVRCPAGNGGWRLEDVAREEVPRSISIPPSRCISCVPVTLSRWCRTGEVRGAIGTR